MYTCTNMYRITHTDKSLLYVKVPHRRNHRNKSHSPNAKIHVKKTQPHTYTPNTHTHTHTPHTYKYLHLSCLLLHQTPVTSHWIQTQQTETSICLRETGGWKGEMSSSHILIIQRDLMGVGRCCVERVCLDAATGRWSGVGRRS